MANSQTQIINKALVLCGAATVISINDNSPNAIALNNVYELSLQSVLSECKWNFATQRYALTLSASNPAFFYPGEAFAYDIPVGVIRIWNVYPANASWREENGQIISDTANLCILYTNYDDNPNDYPSYFLDAFIDKLCSDIAYLIINSAQIAEAFLKKYETVSLPKATSANSQTGIQQTPNDGYWVNSKWYDDGGTDQPWGAVAQ